MRTLLCCALILLNGASVTAGEGKLTAEQAKKLLPEAASIPYKDFAKLAEGQEPPKRNQSPTYFVITFRPPEKLPESAEKDFELKEVNPNKIATAMTLSKDLGYASIIQESYITDCTCDSDDLKARGRVAFKCDAYTGSMLFKAAKVKGNWVIQEFEFPHLGVRFVRSEDGNWRQERSKK